MTCDTDQETPFLTLGNLRLPYPLDLIYERGQTPPQCDAMLLTALTVMGAAMDWHVRTKYFDFFLYPCLQLFVMAPRESGKGAMGRKAILRKCEKHDGAVLTKAYVIGRDTSGQECNLYYLSISDDNFLEVLTIFECLYKHSIHVLSFLKSTETERRVFTGWMLALNEMPDEFTRQEWNEECEKRKINKITVHSWIKRLIKKGVVTFDEEIGKYTKTVKKGKVLQCNAVTPVTH